MKYLIIILIIAGVVIFTQGTITEPTQVSLSSSEPVKKGTGYETRTATLGAVDVELKPIILVPGEEMVFEISFNTHSVELDYDFTEVISAEDNLGNKYKASNWSGGASGHHLSGELEFDELIEEAQSVSLIINDIDGQNGKIEWSFK